ncbi:MAG: sulfotransferase [Planctomycetaceae bacterium]
MNLESWSPEFIGIGAEKSATTWAWSMLNAHPQIAMSQPKELNYFNDNFHRGPSWYRSHFRNPDAKKVSGTNNAQHPEGRSGYWFLTPFSPLHGEISPHYMDCTQAAARIADQYPDTRLLVMLRDPFDRALSHVMHDAQNAYGGVADVTAEQLIRLVQQDDKYIRRSCYAEALTPFFQHFPRNQIGIFFFDDVAAAPLSLIRRLYDFVGADPEFTPTCLTERINRTTNYRSVTVARLLQKASGAARAFPPTRAIVNAVYRRTTLRERVMNWIMVDRGRSEVTAAQVFSAEQLTTISRDLQRLQTELQVEIPEGWTTADSPAAAAA